LQGRAQGGGEAGARLPLFKQGKFLKKANCNDIFFRIDKKIERRQTKIVFLNSYNYYLVNLFYNFLG
jgi:hypothetical protein